MKEEILDVLDNIAKAQTSIEINGLLNLKTIEDYQELCAALNSLVEDGYLHETKKDKYILLKYCSSLKSGYIKVNKAGHGFLLLENDEDVFIFKENLNDAIENDLVLVDVYTYKGKKEGKVIKILKRDLKNIVGEITFKKNNLLFIPDNKKLLLNITLTKNSTKGCVSGNKVLVEIVKKIDNFKYIGKVIKILGHKDDPGIDIISIAYKHDIEIDFNESVLDELKYIPNEVMEKDLENRLDLTDKPIFTIDGDDTKDIDDAISLELVDQDYLLGVHIADVTHYVKIGTALYETALSRGTSAYLADTVIPMIPHQLSNGICSLNPDVIRLTISCFMKINQEGKVISWDIQESFIKSKKQMTYNNVNKILMEGIVPSGYEKYKEVILKMNELAKLLRKEKVKRGYIEFDLDEAKVIQDESGKAIDIIRRERYDAENLIEDFMIAANETVASQIANMDLPFIYRIHDIPNSEKIEDFKNFVTSLGYSLKTKTISLTGKTMQEILGELKDKKEYEILSDMLLRSMKKAEYSTHNIGHFGLSSKMYTHFTSPIRRFPDLTVHRLLRTYLFNKDLSIGTIDFNSSYLKIIAEHASEKEVAAVEAERDVLDMKMAEYMKKYIGTTFKGMISGVTSFGIFVKLENLVEGLVHVSTLEGFYDYVPELVSLVASNKSKVYRLGDEITIKVVSANKENGTIDFEIFEEENGN